MPATLLIALLLAAALWWTLSPLLRRAPAAAGDATRRLDLAARTETRLEEITDLEFDHAMGKIEADDYQALRGDLVREAAGLIRELDAEEARAERAHDARPGARPTRGGGPAAAALALLAALAAATPARAQAPGGGGALPPGHPPLEGESALTAADTTTTAVTVRVTLRNGTTGAPARVEQVVVSALGQMGMVQLGATGAAEGEAALPGVPVAPAGLYLLQATAGAERPSRMVTGRDLAAGPVELTLYDTTTDSGALRVGNVNLVLRRLPDKLEVSWLMTVENASQPPRSVIPGDRPAFEVRVPGGPAAVARMQANTGMMPVPVSPAAGSGPDRVGFDRALQPGATRVDLTALVPYDGRATLPLEASVPIAQMTVYAYPTDMKVEGAGLTAHGLEPQTGFNVFHAPAVAPGRPLELKVSGGDPQAVARSPHGGVGGEEAGTKVVEQNPLSVPTIAVLVGVILVAVVVVLVVRRRAAGDAR